jgi:ribosomal protein L22
MLKILLFNEGPKKLKRYYPKARGRCWSRIIKKMSHIEIILDKK